jgi:hypothetical protein
MSDPVVEEVRKLRTLQKQFFASKNRDLLDQIRPMETALLRKLEKAEKAPHKHSIALGTVYSAALKMLQHQRAWLTAKDTVAKMVATGRGETAIEGARSKARTLENDAKTWERATDEQIAHYLSPKLPGF